MKKKARTISKFSATSSNFGANKTRRSNSKRAASNLDPATGYVARAKMAGQTEKDTPKTTRVFRQPLPPGSPMGIPAGGANTLIVGAKAGRTWLPFLDQVRNAESSLEALSLEKRVTQIEQQLKDSSRAKWTCPEDKHLSPELQKERRSGKETRRLHQERRRGQRRLRILPRRGSGPSPISGTPSAS